ncbi:MAG: ATP-binding protein [Gammaproteobacteria bacterium]|nr:ATP-binding protein [Gammaproteobacteria bacterium]MCW8973801.1 ATP-binding protein [Gammaproteobacteria bacterium]MCW8993490.1 ATP-binding protein [Gammaproteobacteria bacterium]
MEKIAPPFGPPAPSQVQDESARTWRPLRFFNLYRFTLAALLTLLYHINELPQPLGSTAPLLFYQVSLVYLIFSLLAFYPISRQHPAFHIQLYSHVLVDIIAITLLMHASGGVTSGVGMLLVVSVANASMIAAGRITMFFAAMASIAVLLEQVYSGFVSGPAEVNYSLAGLLGITLFATAILAHVLARRARESEALARQRSVDLANMAQLTDYIIQHMQTGVMVIDPDNRVRLINSSARQLLGAPETRPNTPLQHYSPTLLLQLQNWKRNPAGATGPLHISNNPLELLPRFMGIGRQRNDGTLIFLEDAAATTHRAQQMKLASLGRLTASIAHEIRNPLGAISHAGSLLEESPQLDADDQRLADIVCKQSRRINTIIENVLQLGRGANNKQDEQITLKPWLEEYVEEFAQTQPEAGGAIRLNVQPADLTLVFDPHHLRQLLCNLCENGLRHAAGADTPVKLQLEAGMSDLAHGYLDVIDAGPGITGEHRVHIFEPFFTTESSGTGLGLYLARELAVYNQAQLRYEPTEENQSRFRLLFRASRGSR